MSGWAESGCCSRCRRCGEKRSREQRFSPDVPVSPPVSRQLRFGVADTQHVTFMHHDVLRVAAEGPAGGVRGREVIGADHAVAVVFQTGFAVLAVFAAVDDATDTHQVADLVSGNMTAESRPTISCPGTQGNCVPAHSDRTWCKSEWQMPQKAISIWTSWAAGARRWICRGSRGLSPAWAP